MASALLEVLRRCQAATAEPAAFLLGLRAVVDTFFSSPDGWSSYVLGAADAEPVVIFGHHFATIVRSTSLSSADFMEAVSALYDLLQRVRGREARVFMWAREIVPTSS